MKNLFVLGVIILMASCQQDKYGYVDNVKLMEGYQEKIDIEERYQEKSDVLTKRRDSISQAFQIEAQAFQAKAERMSQKAAQEEYSVLQQRGQLIGQQLQQQEQLLQQEGQTEMDSLVSKVKTAIADYGKANGYTFIFGGGEGGSVLYGDEAKDLTEEVLKILNEGYEN